MAKAFRIFLLPIYGDFIFKPNGVIKLAWDTLLCMITLFTVMIISISLCFSVVLEKVFYLAEREELLGSTAFYKVFIGLSAFFYTLNLFVGIHTSYYENGEHITDLVRIRSRYVRREFFLDLISNLPLYRIFFTFIISSNDYLHCIDQSNSNGDIIFQILFFIKLKEIYDLLNQYEERFSLYETVEALFSLLRLIASILFINHFFACVWFLIADYEIGQNQTAWLSPEGHKAWMESYIKSLYWSMTTLTTVGYGDITPKSVKEMYFTMIVMLAGSTIFGFSINKIGTILENINRKYTATR